MRKFFKALVLILGLFWALLTSAFANLTTAINHIVNQQAGDMQIGIYIKNLASNQVLYNLDGLRPMTPASNAKVFTAAAAYLYLGPTYHFTTEIDSTASIAPTLKGNVYINFSGDPTLTSHDLYNLVWQLRQKGVRRINGNVVIDDSVFTGPKYGLGWSQDDYSHCYAAPVGGAIINSNCRAVRVVKARESWVTALAVKNPNDYAVQVVTAAFRREGVRVTGKFINGITPQSATALVKHNSKSLQSILSYMLKHSDNVYAGAIGKTLGSVYYGIGSYKGGVNAINAILTSHLGSTFKPVYLEDTSGLSVYNLVSPQQLVQVFEYMYHQPKLGNTFIRSLAISGQGGTLVYRLNRWPLLGHVYGKTGTLNGVSTLSGYLMVPKHPVVVFAIMMNNIQDGNYYAHVVQDKIVQAIVANT